jgi:tRNA-splicing ligase RtcB
MDEGVFDQVANVATLPGIVGYALCRPDGHFGGVEGILDI